MVVLLCCISVNSFVSHTDVNDVDVDLIGQGLINEQHAFNMQTTKNTHPSERYMGTSDEATTDLLMKYHMLDLWKQYYMYNKLKNIEMVSTILTTSRRNHITVFF